ncbi:MAG: hypothetical protein CVU39_06235 [Chloroflexi bacterium HGW-Chloroflexi-10]|nr:MAG: hypothetical protein CVU39_06235 [Chloroflexi bacterium HGW-Chloroflexi-10]
MENNEYLPIDEEGMESEEDLGRQESSVYSKAVIWGTDWTSETIVNQLKKKNIDLNPDFQRRDAWDQSKKSKFIESLILGLPVPPIILAERKDKKNSFLVIDGKQRLLSIMQFCAKEEEPEFIHLYLKNLEILTDLNGLNYSKMIANQDLTDLINQFDNQTIRTVVIRNWPNEKFLYTVFLRLNTGSLKLSPQELRQALHPGEFLSHISKYAENDNPVWKVIRLTKPDSRMRDIELILRYFAFKNFLEKYKNSLKDFMDYTCNTINLDWTLNSQKYIDQLNELENAITFTTKIFGEKNRFTKYIRGEYSSIFNRTIFDIMVYHFSNMELRNQLTGKEDNIKLLFEKLMTGNQKFIISVSGSTKDGDKTSARFKIFGEAIKTIAEG